MGPLVELTSGASHVVISARVRTGFVVAAFPVVRAPHLWSAAVLRLSGLTEGRRGQFPRALLTASGRVRTDPPSKVSGYSFRVCEGECGELLGKPCQHVLLGPGFSSLSAAGEIKPSTKHHSPVRKHAAEALPTTRDRAPTEAGLPTEKRRVHSAITGPENCTTDCTTPWYNQSPHPKTPLAAETAPKLYHRTPLETVDYPPFTLLRAERFLALRRVCGGRL